MSLLPIISLQSQSPDATTAYLVDSTVYDISTQLATSVVSSTIQVTFPNSPMLFPQAPINSDGTLLEEALPPNTETPIVVALSASTPTTAVAFALGTAALILSDTSVVVGSRLANGIYTYGYSLLFADGTTASSTGSFLLVGTAQVVLDSRIGAFALLNLADTNPTDESVESLYELSMAILAASNIYYAGDAIAAQKICDWIDIRCDTLDLSSMITNYGQLSSINL